MALFKKKDKVVDWRYKRADIRQPAVRQISSSSNDDSQNNLGYLGEMMGAAQPSNSDSDDYNSSDSGEKKKKLAKRIFEMTDRIEDLSNQIYHLQQRIEVLERKTGRSFE